MILLNLSIEDVSPAIEGKIVKIVKFEGQLDSSNVEDAKKLMDEVIDKNPAKLFLVFDFEKLAYLNSRAIGCLVECYETIAKGGGKIIIVRPTENVEDVITVVGIIKVIPMYKTVEEAVAALRTEEK